jgi:hypothetical protein
MKAWPLLLACALAGCNGPEPAEKAIALARAEAEEAPRTLEPLPFLPAAVTRPEAISIKRDPFKP